MSVRPALLPLNHPLSYSYSPTKSHVNGSQDVASTKSSLSNPSSLENRVKYLYEHQQITDLLNEYAYVLDVCMVDHGAAEKWAALFTDDCDVTYPFGNHQGKKGLATWAMNAETRFHRMLVSFTYLYFTIRSVQVYEPELFPSSLRQYKKYSDQPSTPHPISPSHLTPIPTTSHTLARPSTRSAASTPPTWERRSTKVDTTTGVFARMNSSKVASGGSRTCFSMSIGRVATLWA